VLYDPQIRNQRVEQFMTKNVLTIEDTAMLGMAANLFVLHRIHRLPVMKDGRVVGIISRSDLLRYFVNTGTKIEAFFDTLKSTNGSDTVPTAAL
jgi:signal-transduction protein with cAMP-binding, CBS, and nucleotidyltransferase domain